jgi:hypothetical protein
MKAINEKLKTLANQSKLVKQPEIYQHFNNTEVDYQAILNSKFIYKPHNETQRQQNIKKVKQYTYLRSKLLLTLIISIRLIRQVL